MSSEIPTEHKYLSILRCRTWCIWSPHSRTISKGFEVAVDGRGDPIHASVHLVSYEPRVRPESEPARLPENASGPAVWRGEMDTGYWLGQLFVAAPEDKVKVEFHREPPYQGEVDIQLHIGARSEVPIEQLRGIVSPISYSALSYVNVALKDLLVPVAPVHVRTLHEGGKSSSEDGIRIAARERRRFSADVLTGALDAFVAWRSREPAVERVALDAAMRRYVTAQTESDSVDKYCDLWEACEFATHGVKAKGGKVGRISEALTRQMERAGIRRKKSVVENALEIKSLHETRGDLVHNALQYPRDLEKSTELLDSIASELIRSRLGLGYEKRPTIENRFNPAPG